MTTVKQILSVKGEDVITGDASMTLGQAVARLAGHKIGALIFVDGDRRVIGILSERDIVASLALHGARVLEELATAHMTRKVSTCTREDTVEDLMDMMTAGRFRHLPVVEDGKLVGMVSIGDVVKHRVADIEHQASEIRNYLFTT
ncbi:inosine-5-monophosphate dehydrogenase [Pleomorphomonas diazotrophica]|uniref:Inosine-5-monophosphate dehydrogenase n=1 Tax=Pleomorphomonas diazotrophica TaxID=1166257 RepID=A0A1I4WE62_9HYPH|nr:CBS domain-containing protein [Pleomorphomonas diazotrophica]PKR88980.1 inosine-5-monophosphate dehydrogenase [Pleomorphomonas diazotrophica]SFN11928.1 CBS domain-containing protein [Pleomorphomonas diazotrophica]